MGTAASSFLNPIVADPDDAGPKPAATALARRPDFGSLYAKPRLTAIVGTAMAFGLAGLFFLGQRALHSQGTGTQSHRQRLIQQFPFPDDEETVAGLNVPNAPG